MNIQCRYVVEDFVEAPSAGRGQCIMCQPDAIADVAARRRQWGCGLLIAGAVLMLSSSVHLSLCHSRAWLLAAAMVVLLMGNILRQLIPRWTQSRLRRNLAALQPDTEPVILNIDKSGLEFIATRWKYQVDWQAIRSFGETASLFLLVDDETNTIIVPKRALPSQKERDEFCRAVSELLTEAWRT